MLIASLTLTTVALGAFAWFAKNWKAAVAAVVLVAAGFAYQQADLGGYKRRLDEEKAAQIELLQTRLLTLAIVSEKDHQQVISDNFLNSKMKQLASETPKNDGPCLDADAARRVWAIRGTVSGPAPVPARRHSILFPRGDKRPG